MLALFLVSATLSLWLLCCSLVLLNSILVRLAPFMVCTLNISILNSAHSIALSDTADSHHPELFCLTTTTPAELVDYTMPGYTLISHPRTPRFQKSQNVGGGTAFLVRETFSQIPSTISAYTRHLKLHP